MAYDWMRANDAARFRMWEFQQAMQTSRHVGMLNAPPAVGDPTSQTMEWTMSPGQCLNLRMEVEHMQPECHDKGSQGTSGASSNSSRPVDAEKGNGADGSRGSPLSPRSPTEGTAKGSD